MAASSRTAQADAAAFVSNDSDARGAPARSTSARHLSPRFLMYATTAPVCTRRHRRHRWRDCWQRLAGAWQDGSVRYWGDRGALAGFFAPLNASYAARMRGSEVLVLVPGTGIEPVRPG